MTVLSLALDSFIAIFQGMARLWTTNHPLPLDSPVANLVTDSYRLNDKIIHMHTQWCFGSGLSLCYSYDLSAVAIWKVHTLTTLCSSTRHFMNCNVLCILKHMV